MIETVELGAQRGADHEIVVAVPRRNRPAKRGAGAIENFVGRGPKLAIVLGGDVVGAGRHGVDAYGMTVFLEAAGVDQAQEIPAEAALAGRREHEWNHLDSRLRTAPGPQVRLQERAEPGSDPG